MQGYKPPTGSPSYSTPVEASPVTFDGNGYAPGGATAPITYTWEFQQTGCGMGFGTGSTSVTVLCPNWDNLAQLGIFPDYTAPFTGTTATHTYPTSGEYLVRLTATDASGKQAVDTFTVSVGDAPPALSIDPFCAEGVITSGCDHGTGDIGTTMSIHGAVTHAGSQDTELVLVNWGDGSGEDIGSAGPITILLPRASPLTLTPDASHTHLALADSHTYTTGGIYYVTVQVIDQGGGTVSQTVVESIKNPAPTARSLSATSAPVGSSPTLTITGSGFVPGSTAQWDGTALATTYVSPTQLTAQVPASDTASAAVGAITVVNTAPGGGTSSPQVLYIVPAQTSIAAADLATSTSAGGSATAAVGGSGAGTTGSLSAVASGAGTVALAQYSTDPVATTPPAAVNAYFDVFVPAGSSFSSVQVTDCNLGGGSVVYYYDGTTKQWTRVSGQTYNAGTGCVSFTLSAGSTPGLTQLSGTDFGVQNVPPTVTDPGAQSVTYGGQVSVPVSATDVEAADKLTLHASGLPAGLSLKDNGNGTGTVSGVVTAGVGPYTATVTANDGVSDSTPVTVTFTVRPAPLTITAPTQTMVLHGVVPTVTAVYSGFVNGETASALTTAPTCSTTATSSSPVGSYPITCSGAVDPNYTISYKAGTLNVTYQVKALYAQTGVSKSGTSVPIKLQLLDAKGTNLSSSSSVVTLGAPALTPSPSPGTQPSGTFTFTPTGDAGPMYQYNVKTTGYPKATYTLSFTATGDPVAHTVQFVIG